MKTERINGKNNTFHPRDQPRESRTCSLGLAFPFPEKEDSRPFSRVAKEGREYSRETCTSVFMVGTDGEIFCESHFSWKNRVWSQQNFLSLRGKWLCNLRTAGGKWPGGGVLLGVGFLMEIKGEMEKAGSRLGNRSSQADISWSQSGAGHFRQRVQRDIPPARALPETVDTDHWSLRRG